MKRVKFGVSGHFPVTAWREWPGIVHADVSWQSSEELLRLWSGSVDFSNFDLVERVKFVVSRHFLENAWREWPEILHDDVSWPPSELIRFWSWSVDFCPACRTSLIATRFWVVMICPIIKCLIVLEFSFILLDLCLFITIFNFILNYVPTVTFWIFTYHKIWILLIIFCFIWNYWIIYFLTCLEVFWSVVS